MSRSLTRTELFVIFFKAGWAFGGGLGILAVLEDELVTRRAVLTRDEFLTTYAIARLVPSGTMSALAVAYGHRFGGFAGTVIALFALTLPAFFLAVGLTIAYAYVSASAWFDLLPVTLMPAALGLIVVAALRLGKDLLKRRRELALAVAAFVLALVTGLNAALLLIAGGLLGIVVCGRDELPARDKASGGARR